MSIQQIVQTTMQLVGGSAFMAGMRGMGSAAESASASISKMQMMSIPIKSIMTGLVGSYAINQVTSLGSAFELTQLKMAGFFTALGESDNFAGGLRLAEFSMRKIEIAAAALPGEAEDYVRVFTQALPQIQKGVGGSLDDMMAFSNRITAIGSMFQIDSRQLSHDVQRMLAVGKGLAGFDVRTFTEMLPFLQQVEGQANLNTEAFNKMTNVERAKLLTKAMEQLQPMLDQASGTWDAMKGAIITSAKQITRLSTAPLFDGMKSGLGALNSMFYDASGNASDLTYNIIAVGRVLSSSIVDTLGSVRSGFAWMADNGAAMIERAFSARIDGFLGLQSFASGNAFQMGAKSDPLEPLYRTVDNLIASFNYLGSTLGPVWDYMQMIGGVAEGLAALVLPALAESIFSVIQPLADFWASISAVGMEIMDWLLPHIAVLGKGIADLIIGIGDFLYPALKIVGSVFTWLANMIKDYVVPVFGFLVWSIGKLASFIGTTLSEMGKGANEFYGWSKKEAPQLVEASAKGWFSDISKAIAAEREKMRARDQMFDPNSRKSRVPASRGGANVTQDFRFSRFTIDQQFAQGYDPDRIAVMFAKKVASAGAMRLQSGFEPLFSVG